MEIQKVSEDITKWRNFVPSLKTSLISRKKALKKIKKKANTRWSKVTCALGISLCAPSVQNSEQNALKQEPRMRLIPPRTQDLLFLVTGLGKSPIFQLTFPQTHR